jgi:hypothetical protein
MVIFLRELSEGRNTEIMRSELRSLAVVRPASHKGELFWHRADDDHINRPLVFAACGWLARVGVLLTCGGFAAESGLP